ncbi:MAG: pyruvate, phosphate dikinase [Actinobacteria bacterium]|nr:pyruvate, phosphate dikinase [Actinomycetota bacterium]
MNMVTEAATPTRSSTKWVYPFDEADGLDTASLGGKGTGLVRMTSAGLPVPPGFIIPTGACARCAEDDLPDDLWADVQQAVQALARRANRTFGGGPRPLLVSVRSGAPVSMPGMMDTILNLGLNEAALLALAESTGDTAFVADTFLRFARMFSEIVLGADDDVLDAIEEMKTDLPSASAEKVLPPLAAAVSRTLTDAVGQPFPLDPWEQLRLAIRAVFRSWNSRRAVRYRDYYRIPHDLGTATVVQQMVFGNLGTPAGTGVAFTRDPRTGQATLYGEFLERGQGEDVVAGTHTPEPLTAIAARYPSIVAELGRVAGQLEDLYRDMLDIEYTVEDGTLYLLQVRVGKRSAEAAVRIAVDLVDEERIEPATAITRVTPDQVRQIRRPRFQPEALEAARRDERLLATGVGASPGQVSGVTVVDPARAEQQAAAGQPVILVRTTTSPQDLPGMLASVGIVTARGGSTSHAAVVARALDKPCIVGCGALTIDASHGVVRISGESYPEGSELSIDGASGQIFAGSLATTRGIDEIGDSVARLLDWADATGCEVFTRVSTVDMAAAAIKDGAHGIGVRLDEVLAAAGRLDVLAEVLGAIAAGHQGTDVHVVEAAVTAALTDILAALDYQPFVVRTADLSWERVSETLAELTPGDQPPPGTWLPLGMPALVRAQARGVRNAVRTSGHPGPITLMVGGIVDVAELSALKEICRQEVGEKIHVAAALRSLRGLAALPALAREADAIWLDHRALTASIYHYPDELLVSDGALDAYLEQELLTADPRKEVDDLLRRNVPTVDTVEWGQCCLGVNLVGWGFAESVVEFYRAAGYRRFAVDGDGVQAARLLIGQRAAEADAP